MTINNTYKGNRWFKCDLHLHTPESKCFQDPTITAEQWVNRAIEQGLDCVAVTDHNSGNWVDKIKEASSGRKLIVFPGVEITCDTSKVHLLVIFDPSKTSTDVNDFLIQCGIKREDFADQLASTTETVFQVAEKAFNCGALVIPAHIDEYNGLESISAQNLDSFYNLPYINAVQVVHKEFLDDSLITNNNSQLRDQLNTYYANPTTAIDYAKIGDWHTTVKKAIKKKLAITTFSDNPHEPSNSKHGIDGIGTRFTWIKMDEMPTLEGMRQAFLLPQYRVKNDFETTTQPYRLPSLWIKSISITNTSVTDSSVPLVLEFSPQLNAVIGGRGSGKSSILRFIRGLFNRTSDLSQLTEILNDHSSFYRKDERSKGVLNPSSTIEVEFIRNEIIHKITASSITNSDNQIVAIQKLDPLTGTWILEEAESYIDFFEFEQYSQKQIYEIAQSPNSLRERIDNSISTMETLKNEREVSKNSYLATSASIRKIQQQVSSKGKLQTEIKDLGDQITLLQSSGIATLLQNRNTFLAQQKLLHEVIENATTKESELQEFIDDFSLTSAAFDTFAEDEETSFNEKFQTLNSGFAEVKLDLEKAKTKAEQFRTIFETEITTSEWKKAFDINETEFTEKKLELETQGVQDISNFEILTDSKLLKEQELALITTLEGSLTTELAKRTEIHDDYVLNIKAITDARRAFVTKMHTDDKIRVNITPFRNRADFVSKLRGILNRESGFESDIDALAEICFNGIAERKILDVRKAFHDLKASNSVTGISGYFTNLVKGLSEAQIDEIDLLFPEDEIDIKYKPSGSTTYKPLSSASAGQKTTAILTLILSQGDMPLLLDQPEDDLDNRLVYELIVDRLKQAKEHRQIIVITHNANIPVNGDAEYIISMNSETKRLSVLHAGTVEQPAIKKEICDVMEGTEYAFDMRSKRYKDILGTA